MCTHICYSRYRQNESYQHADYQQHQRAHSYYAGAGYQDSTYDRSHQQAAAAVEDDRASVYSERSAVVNHNDTSQQHTSHHRHYQQQQASAAAHLNNT